IAHKNHQNLLEAWIKLAELGKYPTLALTLGERDVKLIEQVTTLKQKYNLKITNLGHLPYKDVLNLYQCSRALIFPSITESFGLPLIEASQLGVDIIASELDYVRDVCNPKCTFDPNSYVSIYRAVLRYLGVEEKIPSLNNSADLWSKFVKK
ncbi:glycosyltransferase, partial [Pseudoalteromonas sp.]|uniref:glycosyltransferase n=1 Tax=Pseudoalteromonas sp. TaxID=53249 RepID=UPI003561B009